MSRFRITSAELELDLAKYEPIDCSCGGKFALGYHQGDPVAWHSHPECAGFTTIDTTDAAVTFSQSLRAARGDHRR